MGYRTAWGYRADHGVVGPTMGRPLPYMDHSIPIRPQRKRLRWRSHDYSADATYFVTICTLGRACVFGEVAEGVVRRTMVGDRVDTCWREIPDHFPITFTASSRSVIDRGSRAGPAMTGLTAAMTSARLSACSNRRR